MLLLFLSLFYGSSCSCPLLLLLLFLALDFVLPLLSVCVALPATSKDDVIISFSSRLAARARPRIKNRHQTKLPLVSSDVRPGPLLPLPTPRHLSQDGPILTSQTEEREGSPALEYFRIGCQEGQTPRTGGREHETNPHRMCAGTFLYARTLKKKSMRAHTICMRAHTTCMRANAFFLHVRTIRFCMRIQASTSTSSSV